MMERIVHWFQFADDAAVISTSERENQLLLNCFTRWRQWAEMIIRVGKCTTFGIKKFSACSKLQPKLNINNKKLSPLFKKEPPLDISAVILTLKWTMINICLPSNHPFPICFLRSILYPFFFKLYCTFIKYTFFLKFRGTLQLLISPKPGLFKTSII